jgi:glucose uptake protein GlcU
MNRRVLGAIVVAVLIVGFVFTIFSINNQRPNAGSGNVEQDNVAAGAPEPGANDAVQ